MIITGNCTIEEIQQADEFKDVRWTFDRVNGLYNIIDYLKKYNTTAEILLRDGQIYYVL